MHIFANAWYIYKDVLVGM